MFEINLSQVGGLLLLTVTDCRKGYFCKYTLIPSHDSNLEFPTPEFPSPSEVGPHHGGVIHSGMSRLCHSINKKYMRDINVRFTKLSFAQVMAFNMNDSN